MASSAIHLFGIRHHGPGCARSLVRALEALQPDCILIEGPPEAEALLSMATAEGMEPPVAVLLYVPEESKRAAFYPFAEFSPEWQALLFALKHGVSPSFIDLPQSLQFALQKERENDASISTENLSENGERALRHDPLGWLGQAAGYGGGEEWWEHMVEQRQDGKELFGAIAEAMTAVRSESPPHADSFEARREALREAHMRRAIRSAQKEGRERIAVICGAWHVPALADVSSANADNEILKGLPKLKVEATWVPWTYDRLAAESGYGAGVDSPAWYEHLWRHSGNIHCAAWFARVAKLLREADMDCSSAHVIECVRLSEAIAAVRDRPLPGLHEMMEAATTVLTMGEEAPLRIIRRDLIIGRRLGRVAEGVPTVPLQRDLEKSQKSLRLKVSATEETLELDLRKENDLARSRLLHRLQLLRIPWGVVTHARGGKGTFREIWKLQWQPELALAVIEAAPFGNTIEEAASSYAIHSAGKVEDVRSLTSLVHQLLLSNLPSALDIAMRALEARVAVTGDVPQLMDAVPPLANVSRYGDVRQTDVLQVLHVIDGLVARISIGLRVACQSLDDEAAEQMAARINALHSAIKLIDREENLEKWLNALSQIADGGGIHDRLSGVASRILFDEEHEVSKAAPRMSRALSRGAAPESAAAWLEGFLSSSGMVLVHDNNLFQIVDDWIGGLSGERFTQILPLVRRTFSTFPPMERRQIGERVRRQASTTTIPTGDADSASLWNADRTARVLPVLRTILGIEEQKS